MSVHRKTMPPGLKGEDIEVDEHAHFHVLPGDLLGRRLDNGRGGRTRWAQLGHGRRQGRNRGDLRSVQRPVVHAEIANLAVELIHRRRPVRSKACPDQHGDRVVGLGDMIARGRLGHLLSIDEKAEGIGTPRHRHVSPLVIGDTLRGGQPAQSEIVAGVVTHHEAETVVRQQAEPELVRSNAGAILGDDFPFGFDGGSGFDPCGQGEIALQGCRRANVHGGRTVERQEAAAFLPLGRAENLSLLSAERFGHGLARAVSQHKMPHQAVAAFQPHLGPFPHDVGRPCPISNSADRQGVDGHFRHRRNRQGHGLLDRLPARRR